ncbi:MAG: hypothetical protein IKA63_05930 [Clostridia bacterium]|nr:hypothetical protein [Clostridia bacterium]
MAMFEDVLSRAKAVAEAAGRKTGEFVENTKIKIEIADLQREIASMYEGLGRLIYDGHRSGENIDDMVDACISHLEEQNAYLEELQDQLLDSKNAARCAECGAVNDGEAHFCSNCGKAL